MQIINFRKRAIQVIVIFIFVIAQGHKGISNKFDINGDLIYRYYKTKSIAFSGKLKKNIRMQTGARLKATYKMYKGKVIFRLSSGDHSKPYKRFIDEGDKFNSWIDRFYICKYYPYLNITVGRQEPFLKTYKSQLIFDNDVGIDGITFLYKKRYNIGYFLLENNKRNNTDMQNSMYFMGIHFKNKLNKFTLFSSIRMINFKLEDKDPYNNGKYKAFAEGYRLINLFTSLKKHNIKFIVDALKNLKAEQQKNAWSMAVCYNLLLKKINFRIEYAKVEPDSLIGQYTCWGNQVNVSTWKFSIALKFTKTSKLRFLYVNSKIADKDKTFKKSLLSDKRTMIMFINRF